MLNCNSNSNSNSSSNSNSNSSTTAATATATATATAAATAQQQQQQQATATAAATASNSKQQQQQQQQSRDDDNMEMGGMDEDEYDLGGGGRSEELKAAMVGGGNFPCLEAGNYNASNNRSNKPQCIVDVFIEVLNIVEKIAAKCNEFISSAINSHYTALSKQNVTTFMRYNVFSAYF